MRRATACFSMYSLMSMRTMACLVVEEELGERARGLGLADAGGAEEDEAADGPLGVAEAGAAAADGVGDGVSASSWPTTRSRRRCLHLHELLHLAFEHLGDGDAGPLGDDLGDVLFVDLFLEQAVDAFGARSLRRRRWAVLLVGELGEFASSLGDLAVLQLGGALEVALAGGLARPRSAGLRASP